MALRFRRPPAREWVPMLVGLLLAAAGGLAVAATDTPGAWALLVAGLVLFYGVVLYRMLTAAADDLRAVGAPVVQPCGSVRI